MSHRESWWYMRFFKSLKDVVLKICSKTHINIMDVVFFLQTRNYQLNSQRKSKIENSWNISIGTLEKQNSLQPRCLAVSREKPRLGQSLSVNFVSRRWCKMDSKIWHFCPILSDPGKYIQSTIPILELSFATWCSTDTCTHFRKMSLQKPSCKRTTKNPCVGTNHPPVVMLRIRFFAPNCLTFSKSGEKTITTENHRNGSNQKNIRI